jgi:hypothetical protein
MAALPTDEDKLQMVLSVYRHFGTRSGEGLFQQNFLAVAVNNGWRPADIADGIDLAADRGWVEQGPNNSIRVTDAGFAAV